MKNPREGVVLNVHRVSTELGEGEADIRHTVRCPSSHRVVNLGTCEDCPHLERIQRDTSGPQAVSCTPQSEPAGATRDERFEPLLAPLLEHTRVDELMTRDVYCVGEEVRAEELAKLFAARKVSGMPVVDEDERLVGVVSRTDLLCCPNDAEDLPVLHPERTRATAEELMNPSPVVVHEGATIPQAAAVMASARVHRVLVVSSEGTVVGILTTLDVVRWVARKAGYAV
jgi:CBS domain-containing protein